MTQHGRQGSRLSGCDKANRFVRIGCQRDVACAGALRIGLCAHGQHPHALQQRNGELALAMREAHVDIDQIASAQHLGQAAQIAGGNRQRPLASPKPRR
ncbi:hypothetical protein G6F31_019158 [Rhizopus arrhizus]|nr:hypothetical protein G6F31_019158 [Rhizopus arrhizus]